MVGLGVNIDHVATVRQARQTVEPDPVWAAVEAELGGADCITFHLRKDRRHVNDRDAHLLKETVRGKLNMEMSMDEEIVRIALELRPDQVTLVPEKRQEVTTEGGLDVIAQAERTSEVTHRLNEAGVLVSAFIDPTPSQVAAAISAGCGAVELHSGNYANAHLLTEGAEPRAREIAQTLAELRGALAEGLREGLTVHAGHGLTYTNVREVARIEGFDEFNIGHSIISRAIFVGLRDAVREMKELMT